MISYISRAIEPSIRTAAANTPVVVMTGPRQSGKTTLAKHLFPEHVYTNLEFPDVRMRAEHDPRGFLTQSKLMIIDEVQRIPDLLSYIQGFVDEDPSRHYVLTGSNDFALMHSVSQSLAGRATLFTILPFSLAEMKASDTPLLSLPERIVAGAYPRIVAGGENAASWYQSYIQTYLERDVRDTSAIHMTDRFYAFLRIVAARVGCIINYAELAKEAGIAANTARDWISILQAGYIVHLVRPYHANIKKRLVKSPKLYFYDTGVLSSLLGITDPQQLANHPHTGMLFENLIVSEYAKVAAAAGYAPRLFFYRDHDGREVDMVIDTNSGLKLVEIKYSAVISSSAFKHMQWFADTVSPATQSIVYGGDVSHTTAHGNIVSWQDIA